MKIADVLVEKVVESSWIHDISHDGTNIRLTVSNGRKYIINAPVSVYKNWLRAKSKGTYWNKRMRGKYNTTRIA